MSPKVKPSPKFQREVDRQLDAAVRYGHDSPHSFFRDMALKAESEQRRAANLDSPVLRGRDPGPAEPASVLTPKNLGEVEARLRANQKKAAARFDLTAAGSSALIPAAQLPRELAERYELAARARAQVATALGTNPIPDGTGMTVKLAALTGGASAAVQATEGDAVSNTDPTFGAVANALAYVSGFVDVSRQLLDRAGNGTAGRLDEVIAGELGRAAGTVLDQQILNGSGTSGQTLGLLNASGIRPPRTPRRARPWPGPRPSSGRTTPRSPGRTGSAPTR